MLEDYRIILFYKYVEIERPEEVKKRQKKLCQDLNLKGRVLIAKEGINVTLEGTKENLEKYLEEYFKDPRFEGTHVKWSEGTGNAFPKLRVKVREEIVAYHLGKNDINPNQYSGKYLQAEELHDWINSGKEFYIVDMRNDYEHEVGHFQNSIFSGMKNSKDLPEVLPMIAHLKDEQSSRAKLNLSAKPIVTVCTGGVRCEKASGFLVNKGFSDVYQLYGGIVTYMEKYPGEDFLGSLYVFDDRLVMAFNMDDPNRVVIGKCASCKKPSENFINCLDSFCNRQFIACKECLGKVGKILCPMGCRDYREEHPETFI